MFVTFEIPKWLTRYSTGMLFLKQPSVSFVYFRAPYGIYKNYPHNEHELAGTFMTCSRDSKTISRSLGKRATLQDTRHKFIMTTKWLLDHWWVNFTGFSRVHLSSTGLWPPVVVQSVMTETRQRDKMIMTGSQPPEYRWSVSTNVVPKTNTSYVINILDIHKTNTIWWLCSVPFLQYNEPTSISLAPLLLKLTYAFCRLPPEESIT